MSLSFAYPFPDVAALMDLVYISRSSAVHPTLETLALIQSSTSFSQDLFGLPLFLWPFTFPSSVNFFSVSCFFLSFYMSEITCLCIGRETTRRLHLLPE